MDVRSARSHARHRCFAWSGRCGLCPWWRRSLSLSFGTRGFVSRSYFGKRCWSISQSIRIAMTNQPRSCNKTVNWYSTRHAFRAPYFTTRLSSSLFRLELKHAHVGGPVFLLSSSQSFNFRIECMLQDRSSFRMSCLFFWSFFFFLNLRYPHIEGHP